MHPCPVRIVFVGLRCFVCCLPIAVAIMPQGTQGKRQHCGVSFKKTRDNHVSTMHARYTAMVSDASSPTAATPILRVTGLNKTYPPNGNAEGVVLFDGLDLTVAAGELVAITGESGAGKSTLLHLLAAMDSPSAGVVEVAGTALHTLSLKQQAEFRNRTIGYVWQAHYLLPEFTAAENVAMPLLARGATLARAKQAAVRWLAEVELANRADHRAGELSGGEQQRVSLARALVTAPQLLLADEPTGNLDTRTGEVVFSLLQRLHREHRTTTVLVTHHEDFARRCDRVFRLKGGRLQAERIPIPVPC